MRVSERKSALGAVERVGRGLDVDPQLAHVRTETVERHHAAELREERCEPAVAPVGPESIEQLVPRDRAQPIRSEVCEQDASLAPRKFVLDATAVVLDDEAAAELDFPLRQVRANIAPTSRPYNDRSPRQKERRWRSRSHASAAG